MREIPFIKWEPYKGYLGNFCPHWSFDGEKCANCGEEVPFHIRNENKSGYNVGLTKCGSIKLTKVDKPNVTLNLDGDSIDKYTPLTIVLNGESITLDHEDIKDLFYQEKERKITKLIDFMRDNDFKEKDISGVISNLRSDTNEP